MELSMHLKSDSRGITLLELMIAVSLLTILLSSAYYLLSFSTSALNDTEAQFEAEQDARTAFLSLEEDIRKAQAVNYGGTSHKAVEVKSSGMQLDVYTDADNNGTVEIVQYKLLDNQLIRGEAALGATPSNWVTISHSVKNNLLAPVVAIFSISEEVININLILTDDKERLSHHPVSVKTSITVRSKGAMD
jgi:prepilin-type N-terminal cleavage/methylation domain-containing protein